MAHFAEIDDSNRVIRVVVVDDKDTQDENGNEVESIGAKYLSDGFKTYDKNGIEDYDGGTWMRTSYNTTGGVHLLDGTPFRKNYAGIGMTYDEGRDAFIDTQPFPSWTLNEDTCQWEPPVSFPTDGKTYFWNEETTSWKE